MEEITNYQLCEACGKVIIRGEQTIEIRYGKLESYARAPHCRVDSREVDFFHKKCSENVAIRGTNVEERRK